MEKQAKEAEDVGLLKPNMRRKMGLEMASIFEEVGRSALEKAMTRSVSAIAEEVVAFSDELAKKVKDTLGAKGVKDAVAFIPAWAESVATRALDHAYENVTEAILSGMKQHFPIAQEGDEKTASVLRYKGALYVEALSGEPYKRAVERIEALRQSGRDPVAGTLARINSTRDPGKIQGIYQAAQEQAKAHKKEDWSKVVSAAKAKFKEITGGQRID
jgi:hypothetical protein